MMTRQQEAELLDEVLFVLNDMSTRRAKLVLDKTVAETARKLKITAAEDELTAVAAAAYEQIEALDPD